MTKQQAIKIAAEYVQSQTDLAESCQAEPAQVFLLDAGRLPSLGSKANLWVVHFPLLLPEGIGTEPSTVIVCVDTVTGVASLPRLL
jgi:hypothetical protein